MTGDKIAAKHNKRRICRHYGYVPQEHVHLCDNGMQPAVLYVWVTAQQTCVQPGFFHVLQSRGLFIRQGKIDEVHLEGQISHSQQDVFKPGPKSNPNGWNSKLLGHISRSAIHYYYYYYYYQISLLKMIINSMCKRKLFYPVMQSIYNVVCNLTVTYSKIWHC